MQMRAFVSYLISARVPLSYSINYLLSLRVASLFGDLLQPFEMLYQLLVVEYAFESDLLLKPDYFRLLRARDSR